MRKSTRKWTKIVAMVLVTLMLAVSLALVLVERFAPNQEYLPESIVKMPSSLVAAAIQPFQKAFSWAVNGISGYLQNWKLRKNFEMAYNELRAQNEELLYRSLDYESLTQENIQLRQMLNVQEAYREKNPVMGTVIDKEPGSWFRSFTIDVGENKGIKENMAVVNAEGLVGYISKVYETSSLVLTIVDSRSAVAGMIPSTQDYGNVHGSLGLDDEAACRMYYLPADFIPRPDDTVVTSGIGAPFPKGILIGTVRESTRYPDANKHYVKIEPAVDFTRIEQVLVLVYDVPVEPMPAGGEGQLSVVPAPMDTARPYPSIGEKVSDPNLGAVTPPPRVTREPSGLPGEPQPTLTPDPSLDAYMDENIENDEETEFVFDATPLPTLAPTPEGSG